MEKEKKEINYETFFVETVKNYNDHLKNIIFSMQKYTNIFNYSYMVDSLLQKIEDEDDKVLNFSSFLHGEAENILKMKELNFIVEAEKILKRKYLFLIDKVIDKNNEDCLYYLSHDVVSYCINSLASINLSDLSLDIYGKKSEKDENLYDFTSYMNSVFKEIEDKEKEFKEGYYKVTGKEFAEILKNDHIKVMSITGKLKQIMETCTSSIYGCYVVRETIRIIIMIYELMINVKVVSNDESK